MPLTIVNLVAELDARIVQQLNAQIIDLQYAKGIRRDIDQFVIVRLGNQLTSTPAAPNGLHTPGLFTISFDTMPMPARQSIEPDDGLIIRRVTLNYTGDRSLLPKSTRKHFYFAVRGAHGFDVAKIANRIVEINEEYKAGVIQRDSRKIDDARITEAALSAEALLDKKKKMIKETEIQRESMYDQLVASLKGYGTVESEVKSGYMNLKLDNNVRVKISVDADRVFISEIDSPAYFDKRNLNNILAYLQKVANL